MRIFVAMFQRRCYRYHFLVDELPDGVDDQLLLGGQLGHGGSPSRRFGTTIFPRSASTVSPRWVRTLHSTTITPRPFGSSSFAPLVDSALKVSPWDTRPA